MQYTKDNFKQDELQTIRNEIPMLNLENLEIICWGGGGRVVAYMQDD